MEERLVYGLLIDVLEEPQHGHPITPGVFKVDAGDTVACYDKAEWFVEPPGKQSSNP